MSRVGEQVEETLGVAKQHLLVLELADMAKGWGHPENHPHHLRLCCCGVPSKMGPCQRPLAGTWGRGDHEEEEPCAQAGLPQGPEETDRCREESGGRGGKWGSGGAMQTSAPNHGDLVDGCGTRAQPPATARVL